METKHIKISEYDYVLPDERIAKFPLPQRDHSKLLIYERGLFRHVCIFVRRQEHSLRCF